MGSVVEGVGNTPVAQKIGGKEEEKGYLGSAYEYAGSALRTVYDAAGNVVYIHPPSSVSRHGGLISLHRSEPSKKKQAPTCTAPKKPPKPKAKKATSQKAKPGKKTRKSSPRTKPKAPRRGPRTKRPKRPTAPHPPPSRPPAPWAKPPPTRPTRSNRATGTSKTTSNPAPRTPLAKYGTQPARRTRRQMRTKGLRTRWALPRGRRGGWKMRRRRLAARWWAVWARRIRRGRRMRPGV